jgi:hypothetical protein
MYLNAASIAAEHHHEAVHHYIYVMLVVLVAFAIVPTSLCGNGIHDPILYAPAMAGTILAPGQGEIGYNP